MPHVEQRFLVHRLVLEDGERGLRAMQQRIARPIEVLALQRRAHAAIGFRSELPHRCRATATGVRRLASGLILRRIDAAREQRFQTGVDAGAAERAFDEGVEAERRQVAFVEDDRMAEVDGPAVVRLVGNQIEQRLRSRAVARVPLAELFR